VERGKPLRRTPMKSTGSKTSTADSGLRRSTPLTSRTGLTSKTGLTTRTGLSSKTPLANREPLVNKGRSDKTADKTAPSTRSGGLARTGPLSNGSQAQPLKRTAPPKRSADATFRTCPVPSGDVSQPRRKPIKQKRPSRSPEEVACRRIVAARSEGLCEICGTSAPLEKAHRLASGQGGPWLASNIIDACKSCHTGNHGTRDRHTGPEQAYANGWHLQRGTTDFAAQPVMLRKGSRAGWVLLNDDGTWAWVEG
jgi:hypothetical protein